jgi:hypothetical protein
MEHCLKLGIPWYLKLTRAAYAQNVLLLQTPGRCKGVSSELSKVFTRLVRTLNRATGLLKSKDS